jgi:hypothetical protein
MASGRRVLIAMLDGFGPDYLEASDMPTLRALIKRGVHKTVVRALWLATAPPRCGRCGREGEEDGEDLLVASPPVIDVHFRCPRCGDPVATRRIGMPHE